MLSMPTSLYTYESQFKGSGLYWEENSPEDIEFSVIEMLERIDQTENKLNNYPLTKEQLEFKKIAEAKGGDYANSVEAFTPCSKHFLNNNADIF